MGVGNSLHLLYSLHVVMRIAWNMCYSSSSWRGFFWPYAVLTDIDNNHNVSSKEKGGGTEPATGDEEDDMNT